METVASRRASRSPKCARCRNHGFVVALKGHAGRCRFSQCGCWKCALITERTRIMARQRGIRKSRRAEEHERGAGETGNRIGASSDANGDPMHGVTEIPARGADTEDRTYTELEAPEPAASRAWAPDTDPEIPQTSPDRSRGDEETAVLGEQPYLPQQYFVAEIPQSAVYSGDLAVAMPFHLHAHYASAYTHPAFLVSFGVPPLGAVGFPHVPRTAPTESRQEDPGFFYTPYLLQPNPDRFQQHVRERADVSRRGRDSGASDQRN